MKLPMTREQMVESGLSVYALAKRFGVSHTTIRSTLNAEKERNRQREYHRRNTVLVNGKNVICDKRPRPDVCEICGVEASLLHYHHWDDSFPELGIWVCPSCHWGCEAVDRGFSLDGYKSLRERLDKEFADRILKKWGEKNIM